MQNKQSFKIAQLTNVDFEIEQNIFTGKIRLKADGNYIACDSKNKKLFVYTDELGNRFQIYIKPQLIGFGFNITVNNEPLELLAEAGLIGFILFILFAGWTYLLVGFNFMAGRYTEKGSEYWVPALLIYTVALVLQYQTFSTLYVMHVWVVIGLLMAFDKKRLYY